MTFNTFKTFRTLLKNELKMSFRGMDMLIFAVIMPLVVLVILGLVFGQKPAFEGAPYTFLEQSFGALCTISICAGGVMGLPLVISDYRAKHILKRYQVTPVKPALVLMTEVSMYVSPTQRVVLNLQAINLLTYKLTVQPHSQITSQP